MLAMKKTLLDEKTKWQYNDGFDLGGEMAYAKLPIEMVHRNDLSCKAKVIFAYMTSKEAGYQFSSKRISSHFKEGYRTILAGMGELERAGYLEKHRKADGRMLYELRENYWSLTEQEGRECLFEAFSDAFKPAVVEHESVTFDEARKAIREHVGSHNEAGAETTDFLNSCIGARLSMNEYNLGIWINHINAKSA
jgi:hypothetical protein